MDDVGRSLLLIGTICWVLLTIFGHLLGLSVQTVTRQTGSEELVKKFPAPDKLKADVLAVQFFCGTLAAAAVGMFLPLALSLMDVEINGQERPAVTAFILLAAEIILIGGYSALCTEAPRKAAKSGNLSGEAGERFARRTAGFLKVSLVVFAPVIAVSRAFTKLFSWAYYVAPEKADDAGEELIQLIGEETENGGIEDAEAEMISNIFEFTDLDLDEVMTHRTEIVGVELTAPVSEAVKISVDSGFSRIPVYRETVDDICGVLYIKDLLPLINEDGRGGGKFVSEYLHNVKYVPETVGCGELFRWFTENRRQIAVVLDEYGGTAGLVTMEDLLECIVGNIRDEFDDEEEQVEEITPNTFDISGGADTAEVMERLGVEEDESGELGEFDTMSGFVTSLLGYIPESGRTPAVRWRNFTFKVISAKDNRIERIRAVKDKVSEVSDA